MVDRPGEMLVKSGLPPIARADARLIILGSLPGDASLAQARYYAHSTNQFWRLLGGVLGEDLPVLEYEARLMVLAERGIGLWDVIGSARRQGSLDQAIRNAAHNPLRDWLATFPELRAVAFNGTAASMAGRRLLGSDWSDPSLIDLPSSSAANTTSMALKAARWSALQDYLRAAPEPPR